MSRSRSPSRARSSAPGTTPPAAVIPLAVELQRGQYLLGTTLLILVVLLWVSSSFLMSGKSRSLSNRCCIGHFQVITGTYEGIGPGNRDRSEARRKMFTGMEYNKPFLVTWICTSTFSLYLIRPGLQYWRNRRIGNRRESLARDRDGAESIRSVSVRSVVVDQRLNAFVPTQFIEINGHPHRPDALAHRRDTSRSLSRARPSRTDMGRHVPILPVDPPLSTRETARLALAFCALWFAANWAMNAALGYTSVSSTTILTSMSGFFTLAAGAAIGVESFTAGKLLAVVLSILGVAVVSLNDSYVAIPPSAPPPHPRDPPSHFPPPDAYPAFSNPLLGDVLALVSALAYAAYVLLLKVQIRSEARVSMTLFFGFVGLWNILFMWPVGVVLHLTGVERFELPSGGQLWASILINASITFVSDALYLRSMLLTSPLAVTLGLSLTIPLAIAGDLYRKAPVSLYSFIGGVLVLGSFVGNGIMDLQEAEQTAVALPSSILEGTTTGFGTAAADEEEGRVGERERLLSPGTSEADYQGASDTD
ncbi:DMT family transporter [Sporobolomyces koalae]|uniref:DMT family transporter n=1 Tax=Sporobolomyces koalae TaxID=500713 RepID=UPI0031705F5C